MIVSLPFENDGLTNCGFNDDYNPSNTSYSGYYLGGDDLAIEFQGTRW